MSDEAPPGAASDLRAVDLGRPVTRSHSRIALSSEPLASVLLSGAHATQLTPAMCPTSVSTCRPVAASQIFTVASADADAIHRPSGEMRACDTGFVCPCSASRAR